MRSRSQSPAALVLGGGGILGEAWMSAVLAGLEDGGDLDARACGQFIGTSAGSIVAASLAAGIAPDARLGARAADAGIATDVAPETENPLRAALLAAGELAGAAAAPLASLAFSTSAAGGALLRRTALRGVRAGTRSLAELGRLVDEAGVDWDGRLRIVAVELESGRRVVFGAPGAPPLSVSSAVQASCAIPGVFRPIGLDGRRYVDGGVWSPTNMDAAEVGRGDRVLCLNPTGSLRPGLRGVMGVFGPLSRAIAGAEALALRHRGALIDTINPDDASAAAMGLNLMSHRRRDAVIEAGLAQGRRLAASPVAG